MIASIAPFCVPLCCRTFFSDLREVNSLRSNDDTWDNMLALWKDTLVLDYYHPAVHYPNRVNYYALMAICDVARKKYGTPVWSEQNEKY